MKASWGLAVFRLTSKYMAKCAQVNADKSVKVAETIAKKSDQYHEKVAKILDLKQQIAEVIDLHLDRADVKWRMAMEQKSALVEELHAEAHKARKLQEKIDKFME